MATHDRWAIEGRKERPGKATERPRYFVDKGKLRLSAESLQAELILVHIFPKSSLWYSAGKQLSLCDRAVYRRNAMVAGRFSGRDGQGRLARAMSIGSVLVVGDHLNVARRGRLG